MKKRSLKFLDYINENSWMERMKGKRWDTMVQSENKLFQKAVEQSSTKEELVQKIEEFKQSKQPLFFIHDTILLEEHSYYENYFHLDKQKQLYIDIDIVDTKIYYINDIGNGSLMFRFNAPTWHLDTIGDTFFIKNNIIYLLKAEKRLWYNRLNAYDMNGKMLKEIYIEKDHTYNLRIIKGANSCLFLIRESAYTQDLFVVDRLDIVYTNNLYKRYYPIGYHNNKICYFYYDNSWKSNGFYFKHSFKNNIVYVNLDKKIVVLKKNGKNVVYDFNMKELYSYYGSLHLNPFSYKTDALERFYINFSDKGVVEMKCFKDIHCIQPYATIYNHSINTIHYIVVKPFCKIKGSIIVGYGAYGEPTSTSTLRWKPYIEDGWMIVFAFIRGGGDIDYDWEMEAKTYNKINSVKDFETVIKDVQKKYKISPNYTCIYGRSAGGYLIGSAIARNPKGDLFKMAYTELPYVDILNTTTNPDLPLTELEYKEFGNPNQNIYEFQKLLDISPIDALIYPPDIYVLIRTSSNDTQVYAYESFKWLQKLRSNKDDTRKLLSLTSSSGHFVIGDIGLRNFSEDFFLLKSFRDNGK